MRVRIDPTIVEIAAGISQVQIGPFREHF